MLLSEKRCILRKNQLGEVICQFRFPEILMISANPPAQFQEIIRAEFPLFHTRKEGVPPRITGIQGEFHIEKVPPITNYQFASADKNWRINLTNNFISLSCSHYTQWEEFAKMLDKPLAAFIQTYRPAHFTRVGLRYLNFISKKDLLLEDIPFSQLIATKYLGILSDEDVFEPTVNACNVDAQMQLGNSCMLKIHAGLGRVKQNGNSDDSLRFIFDQDLYIAGNIPINASTGAMQTLHSHAYSIFRDAITDRLFEAMAPEKL